MALHLFALLLSFPGMPSGLWHLPTSTLPSLSVAVALFIIVAIALAANAIASLLLSSLLLPLSPLPSLWPATLLPLPLLVLSPSSLLARHPCCRSHCFHHHCPRHRCLIAALKTWAMATATAIAALRPMALSDCGGSSSNEDGCCISEG